MVLSTALSGPSQKLFSLAKKDSLWTLAMIIVTLAFMRMRKKGPNLSDLSMTRKKLPFKW